MGRKGGRGPRGNKFVGGASSQGSQAQKGAASRRGGKGQRGQHSASDYGSPTDLRKAVLGVFRQRAGKALNHKQVSRALGILNHDVRRAVMALMEELAEKGQLEGLGRGRYALAASEIQEQSGAEGTIQISRMGTGFVMMPDGHEIRIPKAATGDAFWGDTVEVEWWQRGRRSAPRVKRVTKRLREHYVVTVTLVRDYGFGKPSDQRIHTDFFIPARHLGGATEGDKVLLALEAWDDPRDQPMGRVVEVLGQEGDHEVEMHAILAEFGLPYAFPAEVEAAAKEFSASDPNNPHGLDPDEVARRRDFREVLTMTIDPVDAKDFDDALSVEKLEGGLWKIGVHIADVSHYVTEDSALDKEALKRATSVYLVDRVIPMLPSRLSEDICSLNPGVDRMAFSVFFTMTDAGKVKKHEFHKTVIHSKRRFTYEDVQEILNTGKGDYLEELQLLEKVSVLLREDRFRHGGLDFETEEVRFRLGKKGEPLEVMKKERLGSHRLIEEFMLLANRKVAEYLTKTFKEGKKVPQPVIYRVHDSPQEERVIVLSNFVKKIGYELKLNKGKEGPIVSAKALRELLQKVHGTNVEFLVNELVLRCMSKAIYTGENDGHYGLGFDHYTHFTSPIRRYPDLLVHRMLFEYEAFRKKRRRMPEARINELKGKLEAVCRISNEREKVAVEAERESIKLKQVEYMQSHTGKVYPGVITGATEYGIYVRMVDFAIEGLVHMRNLNDDYYEFDEKSYSLVGKRRKKRLQIGQKVKVKVHEVDMQRRTIDLMLG